MRSTLHATAGSLALWGLFAATAASPARPAGLASPAGPAGLASPAAAAPPANAARVANAASAANPASAATPATPATPAGAAAAQAAGAPAGAEANPLHADPPAGFSFTGVWDCKGAFQPSTRPHRSRYEGRGAFGDRWTELVETDIDPAGYVAHYLIGRDEAHHQLVELDANSAGYALYTSPGWRGRTLVMTGTDTVSYANPRNRFVFEVQDPDRFTVAWEIDKAGSGWTTADRLTCRKQAAPAAHP